MNNESKNQLKKRQAIKTSKKNLKFHKYDPKQQNKFKNSNTKKIIKKKKKRIIITICIFSLFLLIITALALMLTLKRFDIANINVVGTTKYSIEDISQKSGVNLGENIFLKLFSNSKKEIIELPYIENVKFSIKYPNVLNINIKERVGVYFAFDKEKNTFYRIDKTGIILEECDINSKTKEELLMFGIMFDEKVTIGTIITEIDLDKINVYLKIEEEIKKSKITGNITKVNFENSLTTITINDKLNVVFPNETNLKYNVSFLNGIIQSIGEDAIGIIDMTKTNPTFSNFTKE